MDNQKKYMQWVIDDLLKNTFIIKYGGSVGFDSPKGILISDGVPSFYDETIQVYYGIPDDYKIINIIERKYIDIIEDVAMDYDIWRWRYKDGESVYDHLKRMDGPMDLELNESLSREEKYREFIITDMIRKTSWVTQIIDGKSYWDIDFKFFKSLNWYYEESRETTFEYEEKNLIKAHWGDVQDAHRDILRLSYGVKREEVQSIFNEYWERMCRIILEGSNELTHINETTDKKQKYKEYVAGELLKKVNFQDGYMYFPWILSSLAHHYSSANTLFPFNKEEVRNLGLYKDVHFDDDEMFVSYVRDRYGVKENEANSIWLRLKKKLLDLAPEI
jgi:hypothetical protein